MMLTRKRLLAALQLIGNKTVLYSSPYAGDEYACVPLQFLLTEVAFHGGPQLTISATELVGRRSGVHYPWWLREVYGHLAWQGLPAYDVTAGLVAHLLTKTYARRIAAGTGNHA